MVALVPIRGWIGGQWGGRAVQHIGDELLPLLDGRYRLTQENGSAALWTVQEKAAIAMDLIRAHQRFGHAVFQSPRTYRGQPESLGAERAAGLRFFISWSRYESRSAEQGVDEVAAAREMAEHLANEGATVQTRELSAGPGFRTWRTQVAEIIEFLSEN